MGTLGGLRDVKDFQNSIETLDLGRFAVDEHNKEQNGDISFRRVVVAKEQVVAGTVYHLPIKAEDGEPKLYTAKVWVKPWENFKRLQELKPVEQPSISSADLGVKQGVITRSRDRQAICLLAQNLFQGRKNDTFRVDPCRYRLLAVPQAANPIAVFCMQE